MLGLVVVLLLGFQLKHFVADYLYQTPIMLAGKGSLRHPGGYLHAGLHALLSLPVLLLAGLPLPAVAGLALAEFVVHYALDFSKAHYGAKVHMNQDPRGFWALHGLDQFAHQLTYLVMIAVALWLKGFV